MSSLLHDVWIRIQNALKIRVGEVAWREWLLELKPLTMERSICYFEAKNRLVAERVTRSFQRELVEALGHEFGTTVFVEIVGAPESLALDALEVSPLHPVRDAGNEAAFLTMKAILEGKGVEAPLFLFYGPAGVGKTYLLRWYAAQCRTAGRVYDGLQLLHAFQACLQEQRLAGLREELSAPHPVVIDGIHRFCGHTRLQQELAAALSAREALAEPTIVTSRHHPKDLWAIEPSLSSRLCAGYVVRIDPPGPAARLRYLRALEGASSKNGRAADVERLARDVRGTFTEVRRAWVLDKQGHSPAHSRPYLKLIDPGAVYRKVRDRVCERLGVLPADLLGESQARRASFARQVLAWLCVKDGLSQAEIGRFLGGRSRASICYAMKALEKRMGESSEVRELVEGMT